MRRSLSYSGVWTDYQTNLKHKGLQDVVVTGLKLIRLISKITSMGNDRATKMISMYHQIR